MGPCLGVRGWLVQLQPPPHTHTPGWAGSSPSPHPEGEETNPSKRKPSKAEEPTSPLPKADPAAEKQGGIALPFPFRFAAGWALTPNAAPQGAGGRGGGADYGAAPHTRGR